MTVIFFNLQILSPLFAYIRLKFLRNYTDAGKEIPKLVTAYDSYYATNTCTAWQHKISVKLAVTTVLVTDRETTNQIIR
jgi:hypothetical protein